MSPRRVLYVDYYSFLGGGQVNLLSVFKALDRKQYEPLLVLPQEGPFAERARALKVSVFIVPMGKARWRWFFSARRASAALKILMLQQRIDLIHANCYPANKLAGPAARALKLPCLWHKQIAVTQKPGSTTGRLWNFYSRFDDVVLAVSQQGFKALQALGIPVSKLHLLYNNADVDRLKSVKAIDSSELKRLGLPATKQLVLAAGMRRPHKGFDIFLKAAVRLKNKNVHFVLLGDPTPSEQAHEAYLKQLSDLPELKGKLSVLPAQPDLGPWFKRASIFVSSSRLEGSPLVVIEAMAAGAAIVATRSGSGEILEDGRDAWLCDSEDIEGLARTMDLALKSTEERKRRGHAAQVEARKHFSLKAYTRELMALYDSMLL
jgi:glycosyltransferase involved in cell wall biosynthesis